MTEYTIRNARTGTTVTFALCDMHAESSAYTHSLAEKSQVEARPAVLRVRGCEVCRQDEIRDAIRSVGSIPA